MLLWFIYTQNQKLSEENMGFFEKVVFFLETYLFLRKIKELRNRRKKQVFLCYGTETTFVKKLKEFLKKSGIVLITMDDIPASFVKSEKTKRCLKKSCCAIIIATPDYEEYSGKKNVTRTKEEVINIAGRAVERFESKVIHICEGKTEAKFQTSNKEVLVFHGDYDEFYGNIIYELREFKLIK